MRDKARRVAVLAGLAISVSLILWLTLFSRLGSELRHFYPPFWSYRAIADGSGKVLLEVVGNIILFLPIGIICTLVFQLSLWQTVAMGLGLSLLIESCQWIFWLGSFEIDDLLHNTIGAALGSVLVGRMLPLHERKRNTLILLLLIVLTVLTGFGYQEMKCFTMKRYAAMNDRSDGAKNLLVLLADPKYIGKTEFNISYNSDGSVLIEGQTEDRAWIEIGRVTLLPGKYVFTGLSDVPEKTFAIELEYFDQEQHKYLRLTPDIGPIEIAEFELDKDTKLRALIGLYAGAEGECIARPAIYREE